MFEIIGYIVMCYGVYKVCNTVETMTKDYEDKKNNGWIDYRSYEGFRA